MGRKITTKGTPAPGGIVFRETFLSDRGIRTLGEHALELPVRHPARTIITLLIERWAAGNVVNPDDAPALRRDDAITLLRQDGSAADVVEALTAWFGISDDDLTELEQTMEAA